MPELLVLNAHWGSRPTMYADSHSLCSRQPDIYPLLQFNIGACLYFIIYFFAGKALWQATRGRIG